MRIKPDSPVCAAPRPFAKFDRDFLETLTVKVRLKIMRICTFVQLRSCGFNMKQRARDF